MWTRLFLMIIALGLGVFDVQAGELTGRQIIQEQQKRHQSDNEYSIIGLTLTDRKGKEKKQKMVVYMSKPDGKSKTLIQYLKPANIRGVGLLTWEQGGDKDDDQWLYMSASRSTKRIAGGSKKNQFMGTDMAFEDMRPENTDVHEYTLMGEETLFGKKIWKIDSVPSTEKEKKESGYGKRVMYVDQANYFTLKVEYFDHHDRHIKTSVFEDIRPMTAQLFRSYKVTWTRLRKKTSTTMVYETIDLKKKHSSTLFTQSYMKRRVKLK
ncbi:MAG: outer membrane lipoprotein-sorting protein [Desulfobacteraceae bacterium]|nr:outer membrane lipoprotein-sorting protein [Desulfobacteraceae bacterium]